LANDKRPSWENEVGTELKEKWVKWLHGLQNVKILRSIAPYLEDITTIALHHMMDASSKAFSSQTIAIVMEPSGMIQALLTSKSRITKRGLFTRLNRDSKSIMFQKLGRSYLPFDGFCRVVKATEIIFNNWPLQYVEDEIDPRVLTPNSIMSRF